MKIHISYLRRNFCLEVVITIGITPNDHVLKTHVVTGESTSFVRENMLNLSEFLIESARLNPHLRWFTGHEVAIADVDSLEVLHHL